MNAEISVPKKKTGKIAALIVGLLVLILGGVATFLYTSGDVTGTWRSSSLEKAMMQSLTKDTEALTQGYNISAADIITDPIFQLDVKGDTATVTLSYTFQKDVLLTAYDQYLEEEYQLLLTEVGKIATESGVNREELLKNQYGDDYETAIKALFPSKADFSKELDKLVQEEVQAQQASYDSETGKVTVKAVKGKVNRWLHTLTDLEVTSSLGEGQVALGHYHRSGDQLVFDNDKEASFELVK